MYTFMNRTYYKYNHIQNIFYKMLANENSSIFALCHTNWLILPSHEMEMYEVFFSLYFSQLRVSNYASRIGYVSMVLCNVGKRSHCRSKNIYVYVDRTIEHKMFIKFVNVVMKKKYFLSTTKKQRLSRKAANFDSISV